MTLKVRMVREGDSETYELKDDRYEIVDTLDNWVVRNSDAVVIAVYDKFATVSIQIIEGPKSCD